MATPTAKQLAARARFAAAMRGTANATAGGFRKQVGHLKELVHRVDWGAAAMSAIAGYYIPSTLTQLGVGGILYDRLPGYSSIVDAGWQAATDASGSEGGPNNEWGSGGLVAMGKIGGVGLAGKILYDYEEHGTISRGKLSVGLPFALGLILDGPELSPQNERSSSWGYAAYGADVSW